MVVEWQSKYYKNSFEKNEKDEMQFIMKFTAILNITT
jgi:hypothetical protein